MHVGLIMACATLWTAWPTGVNGFKKEPQRKRWITPMEQIMVSKNNHHYHFHPSMDWVAGVLSELASGEWRVACGVAHHLLVACLLQCNYHFTSWKKKSHSWMWKLGVCKSAWWQDLPTHEVERSRWVFGFGLSVSSMLFVFSLVNFWRLCCLYAVELVMSESERWVSRSFCRVLCDCERNRHRGNHSSTSHTWFKPNNWDVCSFLVSAFTHWLTLANHG